MEWKFLARVSLKFGIVDQYFQKSTHSISWNKVSKQEIYHSQHFFLNNTLFFFYLIVFSKNNFIVNFNNDNNNNDNN